MKINSVLILTLIFLAACNKNGKVNVGVSSPNDSSNSVDGGTSGGSGPKTNPTKTSTPVKNKPSVYGQSSIFFNVFSLMDDKLSVTGLGFVSDASQTTTPFLIRFAAKDRSPPRNKLLVPWAGGVMYVRRVDSGHDAITYTPVPDLVQKDLYTHTSKILSLTRSEDRNWMGWIDDKGLAFLWNSKTKKVSQFELPSFKSKTLQILSAAGKILVSGDNLKNPGPPEPENLLLTLEDTPTGISELKGATGQLSRTGKWLAQTINQGAKNILLISNMANPDLSFQIAEGVKGTSFQATWSGDDSLAFVAATSLTEGDLRVASISEKKSKSVSRISSHFPLDQIVCPSWRGVALYYGSTADDALSIFVANKSQSSWSTQVVAQPDTLVGTDTSFGCPNAERN